MEAKWPSLEAHNKVYPYLQKSFSFAERAACRDKTACEIQAADLKDFVRLVLNEQHTSRNDNRPGWRKDMLASKNSFFNEAMSSTLKSEDQERRFKFPVLSNRVKQCKKIS